MSNDVAGEAPRNCSGAQYPGEHRRLPLSGLAFTGSVDQCCDSKINQLDLVIIRNQNVSGLDVAMDDQLAMSKIHRIENLMKKVYARFNIEAEPFGMVCDRKTVNQFHDQVGDFFFVDSSIDQAGDIGVLKPCKYADLLNQLLTCHLMAGRR